MIKLTGVGRTDVGLKREKNEDSFFIDEGLGLYLVADGMGGAASGEIASQMVAETAADYVRRYAGQSIENAGRYDFFNRELTDRANTLLQAIHLANSVVFSASHKQDKHHGMGSTLAAVMTDGEDVLAANVGDSRIFLFRDGQLFQLTTDHRLSEDPKFKAVVDPEATIINSMGNTLTRAMGVREHVDPDLRRLDIQDGDIMLLCSDGLSDMVSDEVVGKVLGMERPLVKKADDLIQLALAGGGRDNVTVVLIEAASTGVLKGLFNKFKGG